MKPIEKKHEKVFGEEMVQYVFDIFPEKNRIIAVTLTIIVVFIAWILDIFITDPLPFIDEAALTYLLYLLLKYRKELNSTDKRG